MASDSAAFTPVDLSRLPAPQVIATLSFEAIYADLLAGLQAMVPDFDATIESDPAVKLLQLVAYREMLLRAKINDAARAVMPAFAVGADLDQLAALFGILRLVRDPGDTTRAVTPAVARASVLAWLGYTPVQMGTGIGQASNIVKIGWSGTRLKVTVDYVDLGPIVFDGDIANVWRSSNDGAGSGLDADLLDGRQSTDFILKSGDTFGGQVAMRAPGFGLRISNPGTGYGFLQLGEAAGANVNLNWHLGSLGDGSFGLYQGEWGTGTTRLMVTSTTIAFNNGAIWHAGNDGSGSGLDADLLDGQDGSFYSNIVGRLGYTPVQMGTGVGQSNNAVKIGWSGTRLKVTVDSTDLGALAFDGDIANVWRSSNDGAGSGLDADLLDGRQSTDFILKSGDTFGGQVAIRAPGFGLRLSNPGTGYGFLQLGEAAGANVNLNWHLGSNGDGSFGLYQGEWGTGTTRLMVTSTTIAFNNGSIWHAGNDGSGSGLDADLLDGQDGSFYSNIVGRLGYTPVQMGTGVGQSNNAVKIGWSGTRLKVTVDSTDLGALAFDGNIADVWRSSNDGAGSGLDADLLDGRQSTDFILKSGDTFGGQVAIRAPGFGLRLSNPGTGYGFLQLGEAAGANVNLNWHLGSLGDGSFGLYQGEWGTGTTRLMVTSTTIAFNNGAIWHAGNDGAGSGLDADLVDGWQADDLRRWGNLLDRPGSFPPSAHTHGEADIAGAFVNASHQANGYQVLPGGLILQWVTGPYQSAGVEAAVFVGWPIAFPNACFQAFPATQINSASDRGDSWFQLVGDPATDGCTVFRQRSGNPNDSAATAPKIFAIGR